MRNPRFVIQEHFSRTHHYDFRLEKDEVFKSWVLRKFFAHSPRIRRLEIQVDDHEYLLPHSAIDKARIQPSV